MLFEVGFTMLQPRPMKVLAILPLLALLIGGFSKVMEDFARCRSVPETHLMGSPNRPLPPFPPLAMSVWFDH